jgi:hypothetical protein
MSDQDYVEGMGKDLEAVQAMVNSLPPEIPSPAARAILAVEMSFRVAGEGLLPVVVVDYERKMVQVPDGCDGKDIPRFMWAVLEAEKAECVYFGYVTSADNLCVLFMTTAVLHKLICPIKDGQLGEWRVETVGG